ILADTLQLDKFVVAAWENPTVLGHHGFGCPVHISGRGIVSEPLPMQQYLTLGGCGKRNDIREMRQEPVKVREPLLYARLLKDDFREPDDIRVGGMPPRQIALMLVIPCDDIVGKRHAAKVPFFQLASNIRMR